MSEVCVFDTTDSFVKVSGEHGRKVVVRNSPKEKYKRSKVDGCLVTNKTAADWVISKVNVGDVIIELKGKNVDHAVEQVKETIEYWISNKLINGRISSLIVCSEYPRFDTKVQRARDFLARQYKAPLHVVTKNMEFDFDALLSMRGPLKI